MPETIPVNYIGCGFSLSDNSASYVGEQMRNTISKFDRPDDSSITLQSPKAQVLADINDLHYCEDAGLRATRKAFLEAREVICRLPSDIPVPEVSTEPDGAISFDWMPSKRRIFSLTVSGNRNFPWAMLDGSNTSRGVERNCWYGIPPNLLLKIKEISPK